MIVFFFQIKIIHGYKKLPFFNLLNLSFGYPFGPKIPSDMLDCRILPGKYMCPREFYDYTLSLNTRAMYVYLLTLL